MSLAIRRRVEAGACRSERAGSGVASLPSLLAVLALAGCAGEQSALAPAGLEAARVLRLFWFMAGTAVIIWVLVIGLAVYASKIRPGRHSEVGASRLVVLGGIAFPTVALGLLLAYGLAMMPDLRRPGDGLRINVSGEQWWWRVAYDPGSGDGGLVPSANEVRVPVGQRVEILLSSPDVIHSFWIPPLAGKVDMIPGRVNRLVIEATETGVFRGACAEYCGTSHALMAFSVVVMEEDAFARWLQAQAEPAAEPESEIARRGRDLFGQTGCGGCHAVRGTDARGVIGPDLTHLADRELLAAGILPMTTGALERWIAHTDEVKPDARMPAFGALPRGDLEAIVAYLWTLR